MPEFDSKIMQKETLLQALNILEDSHIQDNKHRLGNCGSQDIDQVIKLIKRAVETEEVRRLEREINSTRKKIGVIVKRAMNEISSEK